MLLCVLNFICYCIQATNGIFSQTYALYAFAVPVHEILIGKLFPIIILVESNFYVFYFLCLSVFTLHRSVMSFVAHP
jgi:hypothetical protein